MNLSGTLFGSTSRIALEGEGKGGGSDSAFDLAKALADPATKTVLTEWAEREVAAPLKSKNTELLDKLTKYKIKDPKDPNKEIYIDPQEAINAIEQVRTNRAPNIEEEVRKATEVVEGKYKNQVDTLENRLREKDQEVSSERTLRHNLLIAQDLRTSLLASNIKEGKIHLHERYLREFVRVQTDNGKERIVVVDESGNPRYGSQGLMTLTEFITEYREKNKDVQEDWKSTAKSGSGTQAGGGGSGRGVVVNQDLHPTERMKVARRASQR